ncbi:MAG: alpha/beta hydrolase family protein [Armatimonadota bacterium]
MDTRHDFEGYLERLYARHTREWAYPAGDPAAFRRWQPRARKQLLKLLTMEHREQVPLHLRREVVEETADYTRERLSYDTLPGITVPAYLLIPKGVKLPAPAVLCPPGHGNGMNQVLDESPGIYQEYPKELARRGMVALVPEHVGFGERLGEEGKDRRSSHLYNYLVLNLLGESQQGLFIWDLMRALDVLEGLPEVIAGRIGCYGLSLGGETTLLLSAADTRIKAACVSGFLTSYKSCFFDQAHCGCGYSFGMARAFEMIDLAALIAPRPLLLESATEDPIFFVDDAKAVFAELQRLYAALGVPERVGQEVFVGEHEISGRVAYDWLARQLKAPQPVCARVG